MKQERQSEGWGSKFKPGLMLKVIAIAVMLFSALTNARATDWSQWFNIGNNVWVSYAQVDSSTWTWKFQNIDDRTITFMRFKYTDRDGVHEDVLPGNLKRNEAIGGWAAFTASSRPAIEILQIQRK